MDLVAIYSSMGSLIKLAILVAFVLGFAGLVIWRHKRKIRKAQEQAASEWENDFLNYR